MRVLYVVLGCVDDRQYDPGSVDLNQGIMTGHLGYIYYLFTNHKLPDFDPREVYQFFHPPLHHAIEAIELSICNLFTNNQHAMLESLQILPCIYSILTLFVLLGICRKLPMGKMAEHIALAVFAFHPSLILLSGSVNNDCLSVLFSVLCLYTTMCYVQNKSYKNIIAIALSISLGMITKLSVSLLAFPIAAVFIYEFIKEWRESGFPRPRFIQYVVFGCVCAPIGLSWAIRCYIQFDMPLNYVNRLPADSWQYVGNYSLLQRFGIPNPIAFIKGLAHGSLGFGENMWMQLFRTAALGECDLSLSPMYEKIMSLIVMGVAGVLALLAFYCMMRVFCSKKWDILVSYKLLLLIAYGILFASYVQFCVNYPHQCTMNFRYIILTIIPPALALGLWTEELDKRGKGIVNILVGAFTVCSSILTVMWIV